MLDLDDVELTFPCIKIQSHLFNLRFLKLLLFNLQYFRLQVDNSLLQLVPLLRQLAYLDLLRLILLPERAHGVLDALLVVRVPRGPRVVNHLDWSFAPAPGAQPEHLRMLVSCLV